MLRDSAGSYGGTDTRGERGDDLRRHGESVDIDKSQYAQNT